MKTSLRPVLAFLALGISVPLLAQINPTRPPIGIHPPPPRPINSIKLDSENIDARVVSGVATVEISYNLKNLSGFPAEADLLLPIPGGATVREFAMYDGETKLPARLLERDEATRTYEEIVRQRRDPALLTYVGRALLRARVFPIPAAGERKIKLRFVVVLPREGAAKKLTLPLTGAYLPGGATPQQITVHLTVDQASSIYSPTHTIKTRTEPDGRAVVDWSSTGNEAGLTENPELGVYITPKDSSAVALSALAYNASLPQVASLGGGMRQSGYFLLVASPNVPNVAKLAPPRNVVLVMDRSGSMQGKKIEQARNALRFAVGKLRPQDHFNILTFSDAVTKFAPQPILATAENLRRATAFIDEIIADGGTNIDQALSDGLAQFPEASRSNTLLFFTDGLPTVGVRNQNEIVARAVRANGQKARTFVFGVGYDVDVPFLDTVAGKLRGDADYVRPDEDIEVKTSQFVAKTSTPVLENIKLTVDGVKSGEIFPKPTELPDLFDGGQLVLVGRYTGESQNVKISLSGDVLGKPQVFALNTVFPAVATDAEFLPRLWASRKIGYLSDEVRTETDEARKKELIAQITALSTEFGVLSPFTALFVPEPTQPMDRGGLHSGALSAKATARIGEDAVNYSQYGRGGRAQAQSGNAAVLKSLAGPALQQAQSRAQQIQYVNRRAFYQRNNRWEDGSYDAKKQTELLKIKLFSEAYFALLRRDSNYQKWASVGENVLIVVSPKRAVLFGSEGRETLSDSELRDLTTK